VFVVHVGDGSKRLFVDMFPMSGVTALQNQFGQHKVIDLLGIDQGFLAGTAFVDCGLNATRWQISKAGARTPRLS
jgi:hypothetical protein